jgi:hypothetical protein
MTDRPYPFGSRKSSAKKTIFNTFDTETRGFEGEILAVSWYLAENRKSYIDTSKNMVENFLDLLENNPGTWFAHNLGYDLRRLLPAMIERWGDKITFFPRTESDIFKMEVALDTGTIALRDSYALFPHGLKTFAKEFGTVQKLDLGGEIESFDPNNQKHIEYAKQDAEALYFALVGFEDMLIDTFGTPMKATLASTALAAWETSLPDHIKFYPRFGFTDEFARKALFGGLVGLTSRALFTDCKTYDLNSSYAASMLNGVPDLKTRIYIPECDERYLENIGYVTAIVRTPDELPVPILPCRIGGFMAWRAGTFTGTWSTAEIRFAIDHGYEILEYGEGIFYESIIYPFDDYVNMCKQLRYDHPNDSLGKLAKLMQNSVYGKFAIKPERLEIKLIENLEDSVGWFPTDLHPDLYTRHIIEKVRALPEWAAWITAQSRLRLLETIYLLGPENVLYYDTDSVTIKSEIEFPEYLISQFEYGLWKLEKEWKYFKAFAPKLYSGVFPDGSYHGASKGIPEVKNDDWEELLESGKIKKNFDSLNSFTNFLKTGNRLENIERNAGELNSRNFQETTNQDVRPLRTEVEKLWIE